MNKMQEYVEEKLAYMMPKIDSQQVIDRILGVDSQQEFQEEIIEEEIYE